ncbi:MAG TPA: hypothetical protein RMH99_18890 [Sandaracinaceae bacterium LLY-WYZ-13_1]|nr:hypothetical protein [Sandaracinaceae bacterium LLY-WYZ-13_1]
MRRCLFATLFALALFGCQESPEEALEDQEPPGLAAECQRAEQPCVRAGGDDGVCRETGEDECDEPPCLACQPASAE